MQRPVTPPGWEEHDVVAATDSHWPLEHPRLHCPQCAALVDRSTQAPPQHRADEAPPHDVPSALLVKTQLPPEHARLWQASPPGQTGPAAQAPAPLHASPSVQALPSLQGVPAESGGYEQVPLLHVPLFERQALPDALQTLAVPTQAPFPSQ